MTRRPPGKRHSEAQPSHQGTEASQAAAGHLLRDEHTGLTAGLPPPSQAPPIRDPSRPCRTPAPTAHLLKGATNCPCPWKRQAQGLCRPRTRALQPGVHTSEKAEGQPQSSCEGPSVAGHPRAAQLTLRRFCSEKSQGQGLGEATRGPAWAISKRSHLDLLESHPEDTQLCPFSWPRLLSGSAGKGQSLLLASD